VTTNRSGDSRRGTALRHAICAFALLNTVGVIAQPAPDAVWNQTSQSYFVSPVAISPDAALVASTGTNNSIRLANLADGSAIRHLIGHTAGVASVAFSPDGSLLVSTADDRTLRLWEVSTGNLLRTIPQGGGNRQFTAVAFHPGGEFVAADRNRTNVALWRIADGTPVWESFGNKSEIDSVAFSPDGALVAAAGGFRGADVTIRVFSTSDGQLLYSLVTSNSYGVRQLAFSPDGQWLAAGCDHLTNFSGGVEFWRVSDWTRVRSLPVHAPALAFSPDSSLLVTLRQQAMEFWSIPGGTLLGSFGAPANGDYSPHFSVAVSPHADRIVTGNYKFIATPNGTATEGTTTAFRFPVFMGITRTGDAATFTWPGGYPLYQVQRRGFDSSTWENLGDASTNRSISLSLDGPGAMFRVLAASP
jgi:WD40 repeat protein